MKNNIIYILLTGNLFFAFLVFSACQTEKELIANISLDKMRVFYLGLDNPISITVGGMANDQIKVSGQNVKVEQRGKGKYNVRGTKAGDAKIKVETPNHTPVIFDFKVKPIKAPTARLGNQNSGSINAGTFKAQVGVGAWIDNFDIDAKCRVISFELTRHQKGKDPISVINKGARLEGEAAALVRLAEIDDVYYIDQVTCKCPGDPSPRRINSLVFKIK